MIRLLEEFAGKAAPKGLGIRPAKPAKKPPVTWADDNETKAVKKQGNHYFYGNIATGKGEVEFSFCLMVTLVGGQRTTATEITFTAGGTPTKRQRAHIEIAFLKTYHA